MKKLCVRDRKGCVCLQSGCSGVGTSGLNPNAPSAFAYLPKPVRLSVILVFDNDFDLKERLFAYKWHLLLQMHLLTWRRRPSQRRRWACDVTVAAVRSSLGEQKCLYALLDEPCFSEKSSPKRSLLSLCSKKTREPSSKFCCKSYSHFQPGKWRGINILSSEEAVWCAIVLFQRDSVLSLANRRNEISAVTPRRWCLDLML